MSLEERNRLVLALDSLIQRKTSGSANELAERLRISRSTFFRLLDYMRNELNAPILYDDYRGRFIYEASGKIVFGFVCTDRLSKKELETIQGGWVTLFNVSRINTNVFEPILNNSFSSTELSSLHG